MFLQDEAKLGPGFDHERCAKPECTEPIRKKQLKRKRKAARRRARENAEITQKIKECFHGPTSKWLFFVGPETVTTEKVSSGFHRLFNKRRGDLEFTPLKSMELSEMARVRSTWKLANADGTAQQVKDV